MKFIIIIFVFGSIAPDNDVLMFVTDHSQIKLPVFDLLGKNTMIIYVFHPLFRLFSILALDVQGYVAVFLFSILSCIPIILLERLSRVVRFLLSGR